jgi:type IV secretory pathway VirB2 component (pilin)
MFKKKISMVINTGLIVLINSMQAWAATDKTDDPLIVTNDFSTRMLAIIQGPVLKVLAAVVLLVGVAGLLRGRHKVALACGVAFLLLLFLPILLEHV